MWRLSTGNDTTSNTCITLLFVTISDFSHYHLFAIRSVKFSNVFLFNNDRPPNDVRTSQWTTNTRSLRADDAPSKVFLCRDSVAIRTGQRTVRNQWLKHEDVLQTRHHYREHNVSVLLCRRSLCTRRYAGLSSSSRPPRFTCRVYIVVLPRFITPLYN